MKGGFTPGEVGAWPGDPAKLEEWVRPCRSSERAQGEALYPGTDLLPWRGEGGRDASEGSASRTAGSVCAAGPVEGLVHGVRGVLVFGDVGREPGLGVGAREVREESTRSRGEKGGGFISGLCSVGETGSWTRSIFLG